MKAGKPEGAGIGFAPTSPLRDKALAAIRRAPIATSALATEVFGITRAPAGLASRLVYELLGQDRRVTVDAHGVWHPAADSGRAEVGPLLDLAFAVVDVETTGSSVARGARVMEFAVVEVRGGRVASEYETLVNPGTTISPGISSLTGITASMLASAPAFEEIAGEVRSFLEGRVFVAHNAAFDWRFVREEMRRARALLPSGPRLCTVKLARRALPGLRRRGLDALAEYFGIEIRDRHRAGGDARATAQILLRLLDAADRRGIADWETLQAWLSGNLPTSFGTAASASSRGS